MKALEVNQSRHFLQTKHSDKALKAKHFLSFYFSIHEYLQYHTYQLQGNIEIHPSILPAVYAP